MILAVVICGAWIEAECVLLQGYLLRYPEWSPLPCVDLIREDLRPLVVHCEKHGTGEAS